MGAYAEARQQEAEASVVSLSPGSSPRASGTTLYNPLCGKRIVDDAGPTEENGLLAMTVEAPHVLRRVASPTTEVLGLSWSPDGTRPAVRADPFTGGSSNPDGDAALYTVATDGSDFRVLVREGPDGKPVAVEDAR